MFKNVNYKYVYMYSILMPAFIVIISIEMPQIIMIICFNMKQLLPEVLKLSVNIYNIML